jgi:Probable cobalt transporter subunit (CbtB)
MSSVVPTTDTTAGRPPTIAVAVPAVRAWLLLTGAALLALAAYYFIAIDQGAVSVFGDSTLIHEFVHDGRHLIGVPCH